MIDCSGSMSFTPEQVVAIMKALPAVTIALYGGSRLRSGYGDIVVVGDRGRIHNDIASLMRKHFTGDNLIDGPAVAWMGKYGKPRIWVSDGGVTGLHGQGYALIKDIKETVKRVGAIQLLDIDEAIEFSRRLVGAQGVYHTADGFREKLGLA